MWKKTQSRGLCLCWVLKVRPLSLISQTWIHKVFVDITLSTGAEIYTPHTFVVNVNGSIVGLTRFPARFVANFRKLRRSGRISEFISVYINHHHHTVHIASDGGRICRPMIIVENQRPRVRTEHINVSLAPFKFSPAHFLTRLAVAQTRGRHVRRLSQKRAN